MSESHLSLHQTSDDIKRALLPLFFSQLSDVMPQIKKAIEDLDFQVLKSLAHKSRGSAATYGFKDLSACFAEIERLAAEACPMNEISMSFDRLENIFFQSRVDFVGR